MNPSSPNDFSKFIPRMGLHRTASTRSGADTTVWHSPCKAARAGSWQVLDSEYRIDLDDHGSYSVLVPRRDQAASADGRRWYRGVWDIVSATLHECKVGVARLYPYVRFSMMCQAVMQTDGLDSRSFGLAVVCHRSDTPPGDATGRLVGGTIKPKLIASGTISVRLVSRDFDADVLHGENVTLSKIESNFCGREFEKQFACRFKGDIKDGVFGKVLVDHVDSDGVVTPVFDFNLTKGNEQTSDCVSPASGREDMKTEEEWSLVAVKELAAMLRVSEDDKWSACARKLGFTDREIRVHLGRAKDPFAAMFAAFKARDGRPEEFVQTLYVVSRMANVDPTSDSDYSSGWSSFSGTSSGVAQSAFGEELEEGYHDGEEDGACDAATIIVNDLHDLIPATSSLCLTPPPTPRKKRSNASEDELAPQKKKCRLLQFDDPGSVQTPAASSSVVDGSCGATRDEDVAIQDGCQGEISNSIVWQVSAQMDGRWKSLGRALDLPETELMCIEQASRGDRRQCAYQTLLRWRQVDPQRYTCGDLYRALCDCSSVEVARMCCGGNVAKKTPCWHSDS